jgi:hypothetical protein
MKGILFQPWKIKFIAEHPDMDMQTRRLSRLKEINQKPDDWDFIKIIQEMAGRRRYRFGNTKTGVVKDIYPLYQVGETVYIKEAWYYDMFPQEIADGIRDKNAVYYRLDGEASDQFECWSEFEGWRSPMMMPEWAARHFIVITDVRPERLQEITEEDAKAEGAMYLQGYNYREYIEGFRGWFRETWNSINAKWKRVYNRELRIYEFWQFPWCEADAKPIPKTTKYPERYHCICNPFVWVNTFRVR